MGCAFFAQTISLGSQQQKYCVSQVIDLIWGTPPNFVNLKAGDHRHGEKR